MRRRRRRRHGDVQVGRFHRLLLLLLLLLLCDVGGKSLLVGRRKGRPVLVVSLRVHRMRSNCVRRHLRMIHLRMLSHDVGMLSMLLLSANCSRMMHAVLLHVAVAGVIHRRLRSSRRRRRRRHHHRHPVTLLLHGRLRWLRRVVTLNWRRRRIAGSGGLHLCREIVSAAAAAAAAILRTGHGTAGSTARIVHHHHHILARIVCMRMMLLLLVVVVVLMLLLLELRMRRIAVRMGRGYGRAVIGVVR